MKNICLVAILLITIQVLSGKGKDPNVIEVFVIQQEMHTGIVFQKEAVDTALWPEINDFKNFKWIDVGWGDFDFYQAPDDDPWLAFKAIAVPTRSVLRVNGFNISPDRYYGNSRKLRFCFTRKQFDKLCQAIQNNYLHDEQGNTTVTGTGFGTIFYAATGKYHLLNTCNTWVAGIFSKAGFQIRSGGVITSRQLFNALSGIACKDHTSGN